MEQTYQAAINCLNSLQTNVDVLRAIQKHADAYALFNIPKMKNYIERSHLSMEDIDKLPIIHVSGTKGKGTTCTFTEHILRNHGFSTGLFTSPHMLTVRERIKINGEPLGVDKFTTYFWQLYNRLYQTKDEFSGLMPTYFQFLTCMALSTFVQEKVDVAIFEVGIGGQYDSTNIIRKPLICGITSIGIDHVSILGNKVSKITWHKAGIIKPGAPTYTVNQPVEAMKVLARRAQDIGSKIMLAPTLQHYTRPSNSKKIKLNISGKVYRVNASLALTLAHQFIQLKSSSSIGIHMSGHAASIVNGQPKHELDRRDEIDRETIEFPKVAPTFPLTQRYLNALESTTLEGRSQILGYEGISFYLDGAHTYDSIKFSAKWFQKMTSKWSGNRKTRLILVFNCTGDRNPNVLLKPLVNFPYCTAIFCPNIVETSVEMPETKTVAVSSVEQNNACENNRLAWLSLKNHNGVVPPYKLLKESEKFIDSSANSDLSDHGEPEVLMADSVCSVLTYLKRRKCDIDAAILKVHVTGSLHLVSAFLRALTPQD